MGIAEDFTLNSGGDIKYTGSGPSYSVKEFHSWLTDEMRKENPYFEQIEARKKLIETLKKL